MLNAISTRAVLSLILLCAPAMAIIPPSIDIRLDGAAQVGEYAYAVQSGDKVGLAVSAKAGDLVWAYALPLDKNGEWDGSAVVTLLFTDESALGEIATELVVPNSVAGKFQIEALAISQANEVKHSATLVVEVKQLGEPGKLDE
jgi:hypothetical protein